MAASDVRKALDAIQLRSIDDDEVQIVIRAGKAQVTVTAGKNRVTIQSDKIEAGDKLAVADVGNVLHAEDERFGAAVTVLSQINEA